MIVKLLTEHHMEFLSLKGGCRGSSESTLVKCHIVGSLMHRLLHLVLHRHFYIAGFALPIAIVAKCEEIINLAQKILIWRQLLAKEKSQVYFLSGVGIVTSGCKSLPRAA